MHDQRNAKKGLFFKAKQLRLGGQNVPIFQKKGPFEFYLGLLGVIFQTRSKTSSKKVCLEVKLGAKFWFRGCFPGEGKSRLGYVLKTSGHACVQHQYSNATPRLFWGTLVPYQGTRVPQNLIKAQGYPLFYACIAVFNKT